MCRSYVTKYCNNKLKHMPQMPFHQKSMTKTHLISETHFCKFQKIKRGSKMNELREQMSIYIFQKNINRKICQSRLQPYPRAVFPWVHQWPVLNTRMSARFQRLAVLSIWSIERVGFEFPCPLIRTPSFTRKCDLTNSTVQL